MSRLATIVTATAALAAAPAAPAADVHVTTAGSFDPNGSASAPFDSVLAGICRRAELGSAGGRLVVHPGVHAETVVFDRPMTVETTPGGIARIGVDADDDRTLLSVAAWNVHLFGDAIPEDVIGPLAELGFMDPLHWLDAIRAAEVGWVLADGEMPDVLALQEVWDGDLLGLIVGHAGDVVVDGHYGDAVDTIDPPECVQLPLFGCWNSLLNSGLATLTRTPILDAGQTFFIAETADQDFFEPFSSKGWVFTEVEKGGFRVGVFNTHLQAGAEDDGPVEGVRLSQAAQLASAVQDYRIAHPGHPVVVLGDFNVRGSGNPSLEYTTTLRHLFGETGLGTVDAARADWCNLAQNGVTTSNTSVLRDYWSPGNQSNARLDYVLPVGSLDGSVQMRVAWVDTRDHRGSQAYAHDGITTDELSDHWAVHAMLELVRVN